MTPEWRNFWKLWTAGAVTIFGVGVYRENKAGTLSGRTIVANAIGSALIWPLALFQLGEELVNPKTDYEL